MLTIYTFGAVRRNTSVIPPEAQNSTGTLVLGFQTSDSENLQLGELSHPHIFSSCLWVEESGHPPCIP